MELFTIAVVIAVAAVATCGAWATRLRVPVVVAELVAGVIAGQSGLHWVHPGDHVLVTLADMGFALVMLIAGSHVPLRDARLRASAGKGILGAAITGVFALPAGFALAALSHTGHGALYAVLLASSSAALVLPIINSHPDQPITPHQGQSSTIGPASDRGVLTTIVQIAVADVACVVALPLVANPARALHAGIGAVVVSACALAIGAGLWWLSRRGILARIHAESVRHQLGMDLRFSLLVLVALGGLAQRLGTSVMVAGFAAGLLLAAVGEPRRLTGQLFAVADGFLAPIFFVRLGASVNLAALVHHRMLIGVGVGLGLAAGGVHILAGLCTRQRLPLAALTCGQLGVPVAAVSIGLANHSLIPGEGAAILLAMFVTIVLTVLAASRWNVSRGHPTVAASFLSAAVPEVTPHD